MNCGIYKITCLPNNKFYIGSSKDPDIRWGCHKYMLQCKSHINKHLQNAWNKYKKSSFQFCVIERTSENLLLEREQWWLDNTKCYDPKIGFNIAKVAGMPFHDGMGEKAAIKRLCKIIQKYKSINNLPKKKSTNKLDRSNALWIYGMRRAKLGKGSNIWHPILDKIANEHNFNGIFDGRELVAINRLKQIIKTYKALNNLPSARSKNKKQVADARWITKKRQSKANKGDGTWYPILDKIAKQFNFDGMFEITDYETLASNMLHDIIIRYKFESQLPKESSTGEDLIYANWIRNMKSNKSGSGNGRWYPILDKIANNHGFNKMFYIL